MSRARRRKTRQGSRRMKRRHLLQLLAEPLPFKVTNHMVLRVEQHVGVGRIFVHEVWGPVQPKRGLGGRR